MAKIFGFLFKAQAAQGQFYKKTVLFCFEWKASTLLWWALIIFTRKAELHLWHTALLGTTGVTALSRHIFHISLLIPQRYQASSYPLSLVALFNNLVWKTIKGQNSLMMTELWGDEVGAGNTVPGETKWASTMWASTMWKLSHTERIIRGWN